jgi:translation initiation factor IF-3
LKQTRGIRVNQQIHSPQVRVIGGDGKQLGVLSIVEALTKAQEENLDLVEIAPQAKPPVVKIIDLGKYLYQEEKKARKVKKNSKSGELKEVRFSPFIAENDFETRAGRVKEFIEDKNKVKIVVKFKGRQMDVKHTGYEVTKKILGKFGDTISVDMEPKFLGRHLVMIISPKGKVKTPEPKSNGESKKVGPKEGVSERT